MSPCCHSWAWHGLTGASHGPHMGLTGASQGPHMGLTGASHGPHRGLTWALFQLETKKCRVNELSAEHSGAMRTIAALEKKVQDMVSG